MSRPHRAARRVTSHETNRDQPGDVERLRRGSRRLARLNEGMTASIDRLAGATVRLYRHNGQLRDVEMRLRACARALTAAAERSRFRR